MSSRQLRCTMRQTPLCKIHMWRSSGLQLDVRLVIRGGGKSSKRFGGPGEIRTHDLFHAMEARSQLRHRPGSVSFEYTTAHARFDMVPALGSSEKSKITEYKDVRGYILFRKPTDIRIIGLYPLVRNKAFDMVSNGTDFRLYLPAKNRFVIGSNQLIARSQNRIENLRPQHFLEALLVAPMQPDEKTELVNLTDEDNAVYILHCVRVQPDGQIVPTRSVWFSRINLHIARQLVFDPAGNILTDARRVE